LVAPLPCPIKASVVAAVHLLSIKLAAGAEVPTTAAQAIELAGAGHSQAYAMLGRLRASVETLAHPAGRPAEPKADSDTLVRLATSVISFLKKHPGCCTKSQGRSFYHDDSDQVNVLRRVVSSLKAYLDCKRARMLSVG
jgi:hypothetical protein